MGYQVVDVVLNDGRIVKDVAIVEAHMVAEVRGHPDVPFDPSEIAEVRLTHNRWAFRR